MMTSNPGFLLDLDGLLINSESLSEIAFEKMCSQFGCDFSQEFHATIRGTKQQTWSRSFVEMFKLSISPVEVAEFHTKLLHDQLDRSVQLMPGARDLLDWLQSRSYSRALVTSSDRKYVRRYLSHLGIYDFFNQFVTSEDVQHGKPDPEPYQFGAIRLGKKPTDCIVFEDSVNGAVSGKASGAMVIAVPSSPADKEQMFTADYVLSSLAESISILENMGL